VDVAFDGKGNLYVAEMGNGRVRMINAAGILSTVAGGGTGPDGGGDGGPATAARLYPRGIAIDSQGNLYISESTPGGRSSIRKVSPAGIITTIAGNLPWGYSGDNGPAVLAQLGGSPSALAVDSQGALYIADSSNSCIRKIAGGMISTVAGSPLNGGYSLGATVGDGGPATSANLHPSGVTVDASGDLYIADRGNCRIRKVTKDGIINTIAGMASPNQGCFEQEFRILPGRLAVDAAGSLYFSDGDGVRIVKLTNDLLTTIAGGGPNFPGEGAPGALAAVAGAAGLALDSRGRIYFAESNSPDGGQRLRMLSPSTAYTPPPPGIATAGVRNGASSALPSVAAGSVATIFGSFGFGSGVQAGAMPLPTSLSGLSIQLLTGGVSINAPLSYASASQINVQIPWEVAGQSQVSIRPVLNGISGASQMLQLAPFAPGVFTIATYGGVAAVIDSSNRLIEFTNPTTAGSVIQIFCTGLGPVTSAPRSGSPPSNTTLSRTIATPIVTVGGLPATVLFSGLAPDTVGEYQVNIRIPDGVPPGLLTPLVLSINGIASNTVTIPVR
jgi:uncharacterized protein (TIGR03437 family)